MFSKLMTKIIKQLLTVIKPLYVVIFNPNKYMRDITRNMNSLYNSATKEKCISRWHFPQIETYQTYLGTYFLGLNIKHLLCSGITMI
jgi:hypothetical protein